MYEQCENIGGFCAFAIVVDNRGFTVVAVDAAESPEAISVYEFPEVSCGFYCCTFTSDIDSHGGGDPWFTGQSYKVIGHFIWAVIGYEGHLEIAEPQCIIFHTSNFNTRLPGCKLILVFK